MITVTKVWFESNKIYVELNNAKVIGTSIHWYPNLRKGSLEQLAKFELWNGGQWIHWEELDEDLSAEGFLQYNPEDKKLTYKMH